MDVAPDGFICTDTSGEGQKEQAEHVKRGEQGGKESQTPGDLVSSEGISQEVFTTNSTMMLTTIAKM